VMGEYSEKLSKIKRDVYEQFKSYKDSDLNELTQIKKWEQNFLHKKEQLNLLLSNFIDKINQNFKDLIEQERKIFENLAKISPPSESEKQLPLNYAISDYLAEKLSDNDLKERIDEMKETMQTLETKKKLYQDEIEKLEIILTNRIKLREGLTKSKFQCAICHRDVNLPQDNLIKCPFCGAIYHYLCVASWLERYNSCPACQNVFLEPNSYLFDYQDKEKEF
ncbi:MAG: hypothetical protein EU548_07470, partial [Promethearchaeota archaeon]